MKNELISVDSNSSFDELLFYQKQINDLLQKVPLPSNLKDTDIVVPVNKNVESAPAQWGPASSRQPHTYYTLNKKQLSGVFYESKFDIIKAVAKKRGVSCEYVKNNFSNLIDKRYNEKLIKYLHRLVITDNQWELIDLFKLHIYNQTGRIPAYYDSKQYLKDSITGLDDSECYKYFEDDLKTIKTSINVTLPTWGPIKKTQNYDHLIYCKKCLKQMKNFNLKMYCPETGFSIIITLNYTF